MAAASYARSLVLGMCLVGTTLALTSVVGAQAESDADSDPSSWLERRVELAESGQFYLMLDSAPSSLTLALGGRNNFV